jgi:hypothetical protein
MMKEQARRKESQKKACLAQKQDPGSFPMATHNPDSTGAAQRCIPEASRSEFRQSLIQV